MGSLVGVGQGALIRAYTPVFAGYAPATRRLNFNGNVVGWVWRSCSTHSRAAAAATKKPGAVSRPGTLREFQFHE
jgi:hypothetical protein